MGGSDIVRLVAPVGNNLPLLSPTADEDLDHSKYKEVLTALMELKLDDFLANHREERNKLISGLEETVQGLRKELDCEKMRHDQDFAAVQEHLKNLEAMIGHNL